MKAVRYQGIVSILQLTSHREDTAGRFVAWRTRRLSEILPILTTCLLCNPFSGLLDHISGQLPKQCPNSAKYELPPSYPKSKGAAHALKKRGHKQVTKKVTRTSEAGVRPVLKLAQSCRLRSRAALCWL